MSFTVLILGGYGNFGSRIAHALANEASLHILIAGRNADRAVGLAKKLQPGAAAHYEGIVVDIDSRDWTRSLAARSIDLVIHSCGPFQIRGYEIAQTCIANRWHYIDLADARDYVSNFSVLNSRARNNACLAISGASTVPALTAAVIDHYLPEFLHLQSVDHGINPGNQTPRGLATVRAILSYCGKPFEQLHNGQWRTIYGWQGLIRRRYPAPMGCRWLSYCDIPDLELLPRRYPRLQTVCFRAGLELSVLHLGTWLASWLTRFRLVKNWAAHAELLKRISEYFIKAGSEHGGMHISLEGIDHYGRQTQRHWTLLASRGDGPQVPCVSAIVITRKLAHSRLHLRGAMPCMGLFSLAEFLQELEGYAIRTECTAKTHAVRHACGDTISQQL